MTAAPDDGVFGSSLRSTGDLAGVFEHDGDTAYFYLYATGEKRRILGALHVLSGPCSIRATDVEVRWADDGSAVGLFISRRIWAVFDVATGTEYAGDYAAGVAPALPDRISTALRVA